MALFTVGYKDCGEERGRITAIFSQKVEKLVHEKWKAFTKSGIMPE